MLALLQLLLLPLSVAAVGVGPVHPAAVDTGSSDCEPSAPAAWLV
jgi:hypothetical protein